MNFPTFRSGDAIINVSGSWDGAAISSPEFFGSVERMYKANVEPALSCTSPDGLHFQITSSNLGHCLRNRTFLFFIFESCFFSMCMCICVIPINSCPFGLAVSSPWRSALLHWRARCVWPNTRHVGIRCQQGCSRSHGSLIG
jgi:hypothetical protein